MSFELETATADASTLRRVAIDPVSRVEGHGKVTLLLDENDVVQIWVPDGFGHAFATLSEFAEVQYKCTGLYTPPSEGTVAWNDPDIAIEWPFDDPVLSGRDQNGMSLKQYSANPAFRYTGA